MGAKQLRRGEQSFFLLPGERLESGIQSVYVLESDEALLLRAREAFKDEEGPRQPGDRWMIYGPCDYVPPVEVEIVERRKAIPLDETEGIYVRDIKTGRVRSVTGEVYKLEAYEELWEKDLPEAIETLLLDTGVEGEEKKPKTGPRNKTRVVTFRIPHISAQIYDYKSKRPRVVFGPDLVMLRPGEIKLNIIL